jgi:hypothetical protein
MEWLDSTEPAFISEPVPAHGEHVAHRNDAVVNRSGALEVLLPAILVAPSAHGHGFCVVDDRPAAHGQDEVDVVLARQRAALAHLLDRGVGHDARKLNDGFAGIGKRLHNLVVHAGLLDGAATVGKHDHRAIGFEFPRQVVERLRPEMQATGIAVRKASEHEIPFREEGVPTGTAARDQLTAACPPATRPRTDRRRDDGPD